MTAKSVLMRPRGACPHLSPPLCYATVSTNNLQANLLPDFSITFICLIF